MDTTLALRDLISPAIALIAAIIAIAGAMITLRGNRINQERRQAFEAYSTYLDDCLKEPRLASGDVEFPKNDRDWTDEFYKYQWLVARVLGAAEEVLRASPKADWDLWRKAIVGDAGWHKDYFSSEFFKPEELDMCSNEVRGIICEVRGQKRK